jgi:outer membrane protein OmpA-like peptidoglycan-associated protein
MHGQSPAVYQKTSRTMKTFKNLFLITTFVLLCSLLLAQDIEGSKDHPLITRYPGSQIDYYEQQDYRPYSIATGPQTGYNNIDDWLDTEGKFTRIYYTVKGETTLTEVFQNYLTALKKGGFTILAQGIHPQSGTSKEVGGRGYLKTVYSKNKIPTGSGIKLLQGSATSAGACYIAARLERPGGNIYFVLGGTQYATYEKVFLVDIIEETVLEDDLIRVYADEMIERLLTDGKIALYGIFFDFDKWDVKPESAATLSEIAKLIKENPGVNIFVVGHTDMKGSLDYNVRLSTNRADAVAKALTENYGVSSDRMSSHGVGPLCPLYSNLSDEGRRFNRRVELVLKLQK